MRALHFNLLVDTKGGKKIYRDGHELPEQIEYRSRFVRDSAPYQARMEQYSGDQMEIVTPPSLLSNQRRVVQAYRVRILQNSQLPSGPRWLPPSLAPHGDRQLV